METFSVSLAICAVTSEFPTPKDYLTEFSITSLFHELMPL